MPLHRISLLLVVVSVMTVGVSLFAQDSSPKSSALKTEDEAAIREVVRKYVDAREARDAKTLESLFTADVDQLVSDGTWRRGRDTLVRGVLETSARTGGRRSISIETIRLLAPDVALADGPYRQTGLASGGNRELWTTFVLKRDSNGWRIAAIRNMLPATPAPAANRERGK